VLAWFVVGAPGALGLALHAGELTGLAAGWWTLRRLGVRGSAP
jgi:hypothetical protein